MSGADYGDFLAELHAAVQEEASLWEVPVGSIDKLPSGEVVHGPWLAQDCARVLSQWLEAGMLALYRCNADGTPGDCLSAEEAKAELGNPDRWVRPARWTDVVNLVMTESGSSASFDDWVLQHRAREELRSQK